MLFTYWHSDDLTPIEPSVSHWKATFPDFRVVGDSEVEAAMALERSEFLSLYRRLRLPACRADVARLVILHARGGAYVDAHFGVVRPEDAVRFVEAPPRPVTLLARTPLASERPGLRPINGLMVSPPGHPLFARALAAGLSNLARQMAREDAEGGHHPYDIFELAGSRNLRDVLLADPFTVRPEFAADIGLAEETGAPFRRNMFKGYQAPGTHWSERQRLERLFGPL